MAKPLKPVFVWMASKSASLFSESPIGIKDSLESQSNASGHGIGEEPKVKRRG